MDKCLIVEPVMTDEESLPWTTGAERLASARFCEARRREYLTWRAIVRRKLGPVGIGYNAVGAPIVMDRPNVHIGVSHGADHVAVCLSDAPCTVDIESLTRDFSRIISRYLSVQERALCSDPRFPAVAWCAKECLYKLSGERELSLLDDLRITAVGADWVEGSIKNGEPIRFSVRYMDNAVVVWQL